MGEPDRWGRAAAGAAGAAAVGLALLGCPGGGGTCVQSVPVGFPSLGAEGVCCPGANPSVCPSCCTLACLPGRADCDGDLNVTNANGCETDLAFDAASCGACGRSCDECSVCRLGACLPSHVLEQAGAPCPAQCGTCDFLKGLQCGPKVVSGQTVCCAPDDGLPGSCGKDSDCCASGATQPSECKQNGKCGPCLPAGSTCTGAGDACKGWECVNGRLCASNGTSCTDGECCSSATGGECGPIFDNCPKSTQRQCMPKICGVVGNQCPLFPCCPGLTCHAGTCGC